MSQEYIEAEGMLRVAATEYPTIAAATASLGCHQRPFTAGLASKRSWRASFVNGAAAEIFGIGTW